MKKKDKKTSKFKWILLIYTTVLAVIIMVIALFVWDGLEKYQNSYDKSKESGNSLLFADELVDEWNYENVLSYVEKYGVVNVDKYNTPEQIAKFFTNFENKVTYKENTKYTEVMPVYDIYGDGKRIAVVSFKPEGNNDEFGFHKWQIRDLVFDTDSAEIVKYSLTVPYNCNVSVNDIIISQEDAIRKETPNQGVAAIAEQLSGVRVEYLTYDLGNCLVKPDIKVTDTNGEVIPESGDSNNNIRYMKVVSDEFKNIAEKRVTDTCHAYIMNIYSKLSFWQMSRYLVANSQAYAIVQDVQASIAWGWHPDVVEVLEESVSDYIQYSDTLFSCKYYGKIYKADEKESYEEIINYSLLFQKIGEEWFLTYFVLE